MRDRACRPATGILLTIFVSFITSVSAAQDYVPERNNWETRTPAQVGMNASVLREAIEYAENNESTEPRDLGFRHQTTFGREPHGEAIGILKTRGPVTGLVIRRGYIVAEFGEPHRVDPTYSVAKSFLSTTVGLAWADGLIASLDDKAADYMTPVLLPPGDGERLIHKDDYAQQPVTLFEDDHNQKITWDHLLRQTSSWRGTLWGKPDWADRPAQDRTTWYDMERAEPGTAYEYNDTRVNLLALLLTNVWRKPLPIILKERVMDPIGASTTWRWNGYHNSWITLDGYKVQSVAGGTHWGGGMYINAYDQARFGLFTLRRGYWNGEQLLPEEWFDMATTRTQADPPSGYGFMNFTLNVRNADGQQRFPGASDSAYAHTGSGPNRIFVDPERDLVIVVRWTQNAATREFFARVIDAIEDD